MCIRDRVYCQRNGRGIYQMTAKNHVLGVVETLGLTAAEGCRELEAVIPLETNG